MARWVAIFDDKSEAQAGWIRKEHAEDHFAYLKANCDKIRIAGGLRPNPGERYIGGMWIMGVDSREEAETRCKNDPYFRLGLRNGYRLFVWGKAPCYGAVTV